MIKLGYIAAAISAAVLLGLILFTCSRYRQQQRAMRQEPAEGSYDGNV